MNVLLIHQAFASSTDHGGTRHYEFARYLAEHGDCMTVVASQVSYKSGKRHHDSRRGLYYGEDIDGIRIYRAFAPRFHHKSFAFRVVAFIIFMFTSLWAALRAPRPDVVMGTSPPIFQAVSALALAKIKRRRFVLEIRDLWPEFAIEMGVLNSPKLIRLARWLERFLYWSADHLIVNSPAYREHLRQQGIAPERVTLISNGVDTTAFHPACKGLGFRESNALEGTFLAMYTGAFGMANGLETIVECAVLLKSDPGIHLIAIGDGKNRVALEELARSYDLGNLTFHSPVPKSEIPYTLAAADCCIATLIATEGFKKTYPNKVFDYMAAGRATVLAIDGVIRDVVESAEGGVFVPPDQPQAMASAIRSLAHDRERCYQLGANARAFVVQHFDREIQATQFRSLIMKISHG